MTRKMMISTVPEHGLDTDEFAMAQAAASRVLGRDGDAAIVFEGTQAYVRNDGAIVYPSLAEGRMTKEEVLVARGFADHETAHKRYSNMDVMTKIKRSRAKNAEQIASMVNACEDVRIEGLAIRDYSGAKTNLEATFAATLEEFENVIDEYPDQVGDLDRVLPLMVTIAGRQRMGYNVDVSKALGVLDEKDRAFVEAAMDAVMECTNPDPVEGTKEVEAVARTLVKRWAEEKESREGADADSEQPDPESVHESGEDGDAEGGERCEDSGSGEADESSTEERGDEDASESTGSPAGADGEDAPEDSAQARSTESGADADAEGEEALGDADDEGDTDLGLKDVNPDQLLEKAVNRTFKRHVTGSGESYRVYSTEYDAYTRFDDGSPMGQYMKQYGSVPAYERLVHGLKGKTSTMSRKLERALLAKQSRDWQTNMEFGALDPKRLVSAAMGKPNVFRMRDDRAEIDTAVSIMIDLSGSMSGSRVRLAQQVAVTLTLILERVGAASEVLGFSNFFWGETITGQHRPGYASDAVIPRAYWRRAQQEFSYESQFTRFEPLQIYEFKNFEKRVVQERVGLSVIDYCASGNNLDGEAVRIALQHLKHRHEKRKILFVLSDGEPAGATPHRDRMFQHLRNQIEAAKRMGITCVGVGIQSHSVSRFYPEYVVVDDLDDLPKQAFDQMAKLLLGDRFFVDNSDLMAASL